MKKILNRLGGAWLYSFGLVTSIAIVASFIYGFDITNKQTGVRRAITGQMENEATVNFFYRIDDTFAFAVFSDREEGEMDISFGTYRRNGFPYCFTCGYYTADGEDDRGFLEPYKKGNLVYSIEALDQGEFGIPKGAFPVYDLKKRKYTYVKDLNEIAEDAASKKYKLTRQYVSNHYNEISYESSDDEDCFIVFSAVFLCYIILAIWGLLAIAFRRPKV